MHFGGSFLLRADCSILWFRCQLRRWIRRCAPNRRAVGRGLWLLVWHFVREFSEALGKRIDSIAPATMAQLTQHPWPGNVRELRNVVERAMVVASGPQLTIPTPSVVSRDVSRSAKLADVQKAHIRDVLESVGWRIRGVGGAADRLGVRPTTLETRMMKLGLFRPRRSA